MLLAALGLAAVAAPAAAAEDGLVLPPVPDAAALAAEIADQAGIGDALPVLPVESPLELPAAAAHEAAAEPATTGAADAALPELPVEPVPQPQPVPAPAPDPPPATVQADPANVNVSVRYESSGDDGAVTQVNVAVAAPGAQYPAASGQYQPVVPQPDAPAGAADAPESEPSESAAPQWTWHWDCASVPALDLPPDLGGAMWTWNWDWSCGGGDSSEDVSGYHSAPVQYRPVNINIAIRINSPGNNGPVVQTNVAVGVTVPAPPAAALPSPVELPPAAPQPPAATAPAEPLAADETAPAQPAAGDDPDQLLPMPARARPSGATVAPERPAISLAGGAVTAATAVGPLPVDTAAAAIAWLELRVRGAAAAAEAAPRPQARPARPAPRRHDGEEEGLAVAPHDSLGLAPAGAPERTLPFAALVLLAFMFASAHSTLASVRSRPTPEAEADAPPDRPG